MLTAVQIHQLRELIRPFIIDNNPGVPTRFFHGQWTCAMEELKAELINLTDTDYVLNPSKYLQTADVPLSAAELTTQLVKATAIIDDIEVVLRQLLEYTANSTYTDPIKYFFSKKNEFKAANRAAAGQINADTKARVKKLKADIKKHIDICHTARHTNQTLLDSIKDSGKAYDIQYELEKDKHTTLSALNLTISDLNSEISAYVTAIAALNTSITEKTTRESELDTSITTHQGTIGLLARSILVDETRLTERNSKKSEIEIKISDKCAEIKANRASLKKHEAKASFANFILSAYALNPAKLPDLLCATRLIAGMAEPSRALRSSASIGRLQ